MKASSSLSSFYLTVSILFLLGCSKDNNQLPPHQTSSADKKKSKTATLQCISHIREEPGHQWKKELVDEQMAIFDFQNPDVKLETEWAPSTALNVLVNQVVSNIQSNRCDMDIIPMTKRVYTSVAERLNDKDWGKKHLVDFTNIPGFIEAHKPEIFSINNLTANTGSILTGPYLEGYYYSTWYNAKLGEKVGIRLSGTTLLYEDLLSALEKVKAYNINAEEPIFAISATSSDYVIRNILFSLLISTVTDENGDLPTKIDANTQRMALLKTLEKLKQLAALDLFIPLDTSKNAIGFGQQKRAIRLNLLNGRAIFHFSSMVEPKNYANYPIANGNDTLKLMELPVTKPVNYAAGHFVANWAVFKNSPNVDKAIELMQFWTSPEMAETWTQASRNITCLQRTLYTASMEQDVFGRFLAIQENKYENRIIDLISYIDTHFTLFDFPFSKTMPLMEKLKKGDLSLEYIMKQLQKVPPKANPMSAQSNRTL